MVRKRVLIERGGLGVIITVLIYEGLKLIELGDTMGGIAVLLFAAVFTYIREHCKENRWKHMGSYE